MKWVKPQSLYLQLLLFLGLPLLLLWGLSAFNSYVSALQAATQAYDRTLLSSARTVSERLVVHKGKKFSASAVHQLMKAGVKTVEVDENELEGAYTRATRERLAAIADAWQAGRAPEEVAQAAIDAGHVDMPAGWVVREL